MRRIVAFAVLGGGLLAASGVAASSPIDMQFDHGAGNAGVRATDRSLPPQTGLMQRWAAVGKCVVGRDRPASLALVRAPLGSDDASDAARRLDPIFAGCLAGSGVPGPSSAVLRRAALAGALGIALPRA